MKTGLSRAKYFVLKDFSEAQSLNTVNKANYLTYSSEKTMTCRPLPLSLQTITPPRRNPSSRARHAFRDPGPASQGFTQHHAPLFRSAMSPRSLLSPTMLRVNALGVRVDLEPLLGHRGIPEEIQWHPDQMPLDLVQFLTDFRHRHVGIMEMALLELVMPWQEGRVVCESFDWA